MQGHQQVKQPKWRYHGNPKFIDFLVSLDACQASPTAWRLSTVLSLRARGREEGAERREEGAPGSCEPPRARGSGFRAWRGGRGAWGARGRWCPCPAASPAPPAPRNTSWRHPVRMRHARTTRAHTRYVPTRVPQRRGGAGLEGGAQHRWCPCPAASPPRPRLLRPLGVTRKHAKREDPPRADTIRPDTSPTGAGRGWALGGGSEWVLGRPSRSMGGGRAWGARTRRRTRSR